MPLLDKFTFLKATALGAFCMISHQSAQAAEFSTGNSLGFSRDGDHFVFEEYGSTDGLGLPYVNLFAIDIVRDRWIKGTPVRLKGTEEEAIALEEKLADEGVTDPQEINRRFYEAVEDYRRRALQKARPALEPLGELVPADLRAHNPPHEFSSDARSVRFSPIGYRNLINSDTTKDVWRLDVSETKFAATDKCFNFYDSMKGFSLVLTNETSGEEMILNDDKRIPKSRGCPQKYYVEQVLTYPRPGGDFSLAVLVRYSLPGFEGPDGRFLAVTAVVDAGN